MANANGGSFDFWDTGTGTVRAGKSNLNAITISAAVTGGLTTLQSDGVTYLSITVPASTTIPITFAKPQVVEDLTVSALGTNVTITFHYA